MFSTVKAFTGRVARRLSRALAPAATRPITRSLLRLDWLEGRDVPASFWWLGYGTQTNFPSNWTQNLTTLPPSSAAPGSNDDAIFDGGVLARTGFTPGNAQWSSGSVKALRLVNAYAGTIQMPGLTVETYEQRSGAISQAAGGTLQVTKRLDITGGVTNSGPNVANLLLTGATATGTIDGPDDGVTALAINDNIKADAGANLQFLSGSVVSNLDTSIEVLGGAVLGTDNARLLLNNAFTRTITVTGTGSKADLLVG